MIRCFLSVLIVISLWLERAGAFSGYRLDIQTPSVRPGDKIVVVHSDFPIEDHNAWIGFYEKTDDRDQDYLYYTFLVNLTDRVYDVIAPEKTGGEYHFRLFVTAAYECSARSTPIEVTHTPRSIASAPPPTRPSVTSSPIGKDQMVLATENLQPSSDEQVVRLGDKMTVVIPPGGLHASQALTLTAVANPPPADESAVPLVVYDLAFEHPCDFPDGLEIRIPFNPDWLSSENPEASFFEIEFFDEKMRAWLPAATAYDADSKSLITVATHNGTWQLVRRHGLNRAFVTDNFVIYYDLGEFALYTEDTAQYLNLNSRIRAKIELRSLQEQLEEARRQNNTAEIERLQNAINELALFKPLTEEERQAYRQFVESTVIHEELKNPRDLIRYKQLVEKRANAYRRHGERAKLQEQLANLGADDSVKAANIRKQIDALIVTDWTDADRKEYERLQQNKQVVIAYMPESHNQAADIYDRYQAPKYVVDIAHYAETALKKYKDVFEKSPPVRNMRISTSATDARVLAATRDDIVVFETLDPSAPTMALSVVAKSKIPIYISSRVRDPYYLARSGSLYMGIMSGEVEFYVSHELFHAVQNLDYWMGIKQSGFGIVSDWVGFTYDNKWWIESTADFAAMRIALGRSAPTRNAISPAYFAENFFSQGRPDQNHPYKNAWFWDFLEKEQNVPFYNLYTTVSAATTFTTLLSSVNNALMAHTGRSLPQLYRDFAVHVLFDASGPYKDDLATSPAPLGSDTERLNFRSEDIHLGGWGDSDIGALTAQIQGLLLDVAHPEPQHYEIRLVDPPKPVGAWGWHIAVFRLERNQRASGRLYPVGQWNYRFETETVIGTPQSIDRVHAVKLDPGDAIYALVIRDEWQATTFNLDVNVGKVVEIQGDKEVVHDLEEDKTNYEHNLEAIASPAGAYSFEWDFGDGNTVREDKKSGESSSVRHTYKGLRDGDKFSITVKLFDKTGELASDEMTISVIQGKPIPCPPRGGICKGLGWIGPFDCLESLEDCIRRHAEADQDAVASGEFSCETIGVDCDFCGCLLRKDALTEPLWDNPEWGFTPCPRCWPRHLQPEDSPYR